jgi:hypothetical protein
MKELNATLVTHYDHHSVCAQQLQIDEVTDCSAIGHLIAHMWYAEGITINENML